MRKPKRGQVVLVEWIDCWTHDPWCSVHTLLQMEDPVITTTGVFAGRSISGSWVLVSGMMGGAGAATWFIPQPLVKKWKALGEQSQS